MGEGLNRAAEVTLHKVFKLDRATNRPSTAPADIEKYERKLKKLAASQSARFVSYNGRTGTWVFEVEHFSRQALHRACAWRSVSLRTDWLTGDACLSPEQAIRMSPPYEARRVLRIVIPEVCWYMPEQGCSPIWSADCHGQHAGTDCLMTQMRMRPPASRLQEAETSLNHQQASPGRSLKRRACNSVRLLPHTASTFMHSVKKQGATKAAVEYCRLHETQCESVARAILFRITSLMVPSMLMPMHVQSKSITWQSIRLPLRLDTLAMP